LTRDAYALDLRQFIAWCDEHNLRLFTARRADIECFARDLEERGRARATVAPRLRTVAGFYRHAEQEGLLDGREDTSGHQRSLAASRRTDSGDRNHTTESQPQPLDFARGIDRAAPTAPAACSSPRSVRWA
jgi:Phage integrase, N-terminal SAM-like domain